MPKYLKGFSEFDRPLHQFGIGVYKDREIFGYIFMTYNNDVTNILLMKEFHDESEFKKEVESLSSIFKCSVYSDTYDLNNLQL